MLSDTLIDGSQTLGRHDSVGQSIIILHKSVDAGEALWFRSELAKLIQVVIQINNGVGFTMRVNINHKAMQVRRNLKMLTQ